MSRRRRGGLLLPLLLLAAVAGALVYLLTDGRAELDRFLGPGEPSELSPGDGVVVYPLR